MESIADFVNIPMKDGHYFQKTIALENYYKKHNGDVEKLNELITKINNEFEVKIPLIKEDDIHKRNTFDKCFIKVRKTGTLRSWKLVNFIKENT